MRSISWLSCSCWPCGASVRRSSCDRARSRIGVELRVFRTADMNDNLLSKTCTPCRGGVPPLTSAEAEGYLKQAPGWALVDEGRRIERSFTFKNFKEALDFVASIANLAEKEGHHPDINPTDGSNWEPLCVYCHDIEHPRQLEAAGGGSNTFGNRSSSATHSPFANLKELLDRKKQS